MGTFVLCAMLAKGPKLLFSCGTGECNGGGFGGEAVEVEANICDVLKAADVEGKLTPTEFLAVLLSVCSPSDRGLHDLSSTYRQIAEENRSTKSTTLSALRIT
jgi:hypothetical protein